MGFARKYRVHETRVYRIARTFWVVGVGIVVLGLLMATWPLYHILAGAPMLIGAGRSGGVAHWGTPAEIWQTVYLCLMFSVLGLPFLLLCANASVTLGPTGVLVRGLFRQVRFEAAYSDIESVGPMTRGNKENFFILRSAKLTIKINDMFANVLDMRSEILARTGLDS